MYMLLMDIPEPGHQTISPAKSSSFNFILIHIVGAYLFCDLIIEQKKMLIPRHSEVNGRVNS
jgi:hypothetical protein